MLLNKIGRFIHSKKEGKNCMKTTGITRRIDELGRIVIPKELRKNMHIKTGELLEIFLSDTETISLRKHVTIDKKDEFLNTYIKTLANKINTNVFVANLDEIVFSNITEMINMKLSLEFENNAFSNARKNLVLTNDYELKKPYEIFPISPNGDLAGYLVLENLNSKNQELIKFSLMFLENYFETN